MLILHSYNPQVQRCKPLYSIQNTASHLPYSFQKHQTLWLPPKCKSRFGIYNSNVFFYRCIYNSNVIQNQQTIKEYDQTKYRSNHQLAENWRHHVSSKTIRIYNWSNSPTIRLFLLIKSTDTLCPVTHTLDLHILDCNSVITHTNWTSYHRFALLMISHSLIIDFKNK